MPKANSLALTHLRNAVTGGVLPRNANADHIFLILSRPAHKSSKIRRAVDFYMKAFEPCSAIFVNKTVFHHCLKMFMVVYMIVDQLLTKRCEAAEHETDVVCSGYFRSLLIT